MTKATRSFDVRHDGPAICDAVSDVIGRSSTFVPLHEPEFSPAAWEMVKDCLDSGWVSSVGQYVNKFEEDMAAASGTAFAVAMVNGTAALHIALLVAGVMPGDEVIIPTLTFVGTANAVRHAGAMPNFVDSNEQNLGMDAAALASHLESVAIRSQGKVINRATGRRIAAIVPVHIFGHPVDMDPLMSVARDYGLPVIEDAAESLGSHYKGRPCGSFGLMGTLSFNGNKIITTGGGGGIVTNDGDLARRAKHLTTTAKVAHRWAFNHDEVGFNYRLPNLNAALGCSQMQELEKRVAMKRRLAARYQAAFSSLDGVSFVAEPAGTRSNYWLNTIRLETGSMNERDKLLEMLNDRNIMSRPVWTLLHRLPMFADCPRADLSVAEMLECQLINLPSSAHLGEEV